MATLHRRTCALATGCVLLLLGAACTTGADPTSAEGPATSSSAGAASGSVAPAAEAVPAITDRSRYATPAPTSDGMVLDPPGPYVAGQTVAVSVDDPRGRWDPNGAARQCAVIDGDAEICDIRQPAFVWSGLVLRASVLGPDGLVPCAAPRVTCRITVGFEDTLGTVGSAPIEITGEDAPGATLVIDPPEALDPTAAVDVRVDGIVAHPGSDELVAQLPADQRGDWTRLWVSICRFRAPDEHGYGLHPWDCAGVSPAEIDGLTVEPGQTSAAGSVVVHRAFVGSGGWQDCGANGCVLVVKRNHLVSLGTPDRPGRAGGTDEVAVVPLRFDPDAPAPPAPTLVIDEPGPFADGQAVTVRATGFPPGEVVELGGCALDGRVGSYGVPQPQNCTYRFIGLDGIRVEADGTFEVSQPLTCPAPDGRCILAWLPGEGSPPYASAPFELRG